MFRQSRYSQEVTLLQILGPACHGRRCFAALAGLALVFSGAWSSLRAQEALPSAPSALAKLRGVVQDADGDEIPQAQVTLSRAGVTEKITLSDEDGAFVFDVPPGVFSLQVTAKGFDPVTLPVTLSAGEQLELPPILLRVGEENSEVTAISQVEMAEQQIHQEEQQRLFGVLPNFFIAYDPNTVPLTSRQKFELSFKVSIDPTTFAVAGGIAGVQQARNVIPSWGGGPGAYGKRYAATYGNQFLGNMLGGWLMPSLLHQDPRYFYKGDGSVWQRTKYALAMAVIAKGDNGKWQPAYANILGQLEAGAIANAYYPALERDGAKLTFENAGLGIVGNAVGNVVQEFLLKHVTTHTPKTSTP
jgi:hypothetical protein